MKIYEPISARLFLISAIMGYLSSNLPVLSTKLPGEKRDVLPVLRCEDPIMAGKHLTVGEFDPNDGIDISIRSDNEVDRSVGIALKFDFKEVPNK